MVDLCIPIVYFLDPEKRRLLLLEEVHILGVLLVLEHSFSFVRI